MAAFGPTFDELRSLVDDVLIRFLDDRERAVPEAGELVVELRRLIVAGGKRLRPSFCYWGYRAGGSPHGDEIVRAAASLELLHTFAIVHDDIMDDSDERRGEPTLHVRRGLGFAILAGDLALVLADELFFSAGFDAATTVRAFDSYSLMRQEVIAGQHLDVAAAHETAISVDDARHIAVLKSGRYSIEKPLVIGAHLSDAPDDRVAQLARFGDPLGEAFQLRDDLLGTFGSREQIGKPVDSDIREGKRNVLFAATLAALDGDERALFAERWGGRNSLSADDVKRLRDLVVDSGARAATEALLSERAEAAGRLLEDATIDEEPRAALAALARVATDRTA
jgi:geranylgeranyl diphosphate synthase, type I